LSVGAGALSGPAAKGAGQRSRFAEADQKGDLRQLQCRVAQVMQHQLPAGLIEQAAERQPGLAQAPLQGAPTEPESLCQTFKVGALLRQLPGQFAAGTVQYAVPLVELAEQTIGMRIEQLAQLRIGLPQRRAQQAPWKHQGI